MSHYSYRGTVNHQIAECGTADEVTVLEEKLVNQIKKSAANKVRNFQKRCAEKRLSFLAK